MGLEKARLAFRRASFLGLSRDFLSHFSPEMYEVTKLIRPNAGVKSLIAHMVLTNAFADAATVL